MKGEPERGIHCVRSETPAAARFFAGAVFAVELPLAMNHLRRSPVIVTVALASVGALLMSRGAEGAAIRTSSSSLSLRSPALLRLATGAIKPAGWLAGDVPKTIVKLESCPSTGLLHTT